MFKRFKSKQSIVLKQSIAFWSPFSQGSTVCSINYAKAIASMYNLKVALIEFDMMHPSFNNHFKFDDNRGLEELFNVKAFNDLSITKIMNQSQLIDGVHVYRNGFNYFDLCEINKSPEVVSKIIEMITSIFDIVIFDCNRNFDNVLTDMAMSISDRIIIPIRANLNDIAILNSHMELFEENQSWSITKCSAFINLYGANDPVYMELENALSINILGYMKYQNNIMSKNCMNIFKKIAEKEVVR